MDFTLSMHVRPPEAVITAGGELDVFTSRQLRERLLDAVEIGCRQVLLDLGGVTFADVSALHVISRFQKQLTLVDGSLRLEAWSPQVLRLCRMAGVDKAFGLSDPTPV